VVRTGTVIYGRDDMPEDFAYIVAKAMDERHVDFDCRLDAASRLCREPRRAG